MTRAARVVTDPFGLLALLAVVLAVVFACGTAEEQEPSESTSTPLLGPTQTQIAPAAATRVASPTATRVVLPTPTRFAVPTRAAITVAPTPILTPTPFLAPTPTRVVLVTRRFVPTPTRTLVTGSSAYPVPTPTRTSSATPTPSALVPTGTPVATPTPTPTPFVPTSSASASTSGAASLMATLSFAHTQPGVQSEVYLEIQVQQGRVVTASLRGPGIVGAATQTTTAGYGGQVRLTWTINAFGEYSVSGTTGTSSFSDSIVVQ